ncbi:DUF6175 family protein [Parabacteroides sp.]
MYKYTIIILAWIVWLGTGMSFSAQAQSNGHFTNDATLVTDNGQTATIRSSGIHEKKKEAKVLAILSAFDTYFYAGIEGLNEGRPLFGDPQTTAQRDYARRILEEDRYTLFIGTIIEDLIRYEKLPSKGYKATVQFELKTEALYRDMIRSKIIEKPNKRKTAQDIDKTVHQFTLTVVPFKHEGTTYYQALKNNYEIRNIITRINTLLKERHYEVKDFVGMVEATYRRVQMEQDKTVMSNDKYLISQTQADVYIEVDLAKNIQASGGMGATNLKAYEVSSGNLLSSAQGTTRRYQKYVLTDLYNRALDDCWDDFIKQLTLNWAEKGTKGNLFIISFAIAPEATVDFSTEVGSMGFPLADVLTMWVKKNAMNGRYNLSGSVDESMQFDVYIAPGQEQEFVQKLYTYMRDELNINTNRRKDQTTFFITIL